MALLVCARVKHNVFTLQNMGDRQNLCLSPAMTICPANQIALVVRRISMLLCFTWFLFIFFACPKKTNQKKRHPCSGHGKPWFLHYGSRSGVASYGRGTGKILPVPLYNITSCRVDPCAQTSVQPCAGEIFITVRFAHFLFGGEGAALLVPCAVIVTVLVTVMLVWRFS